MSPLQLAAQRVAERARALDAQADNVPSPCNSVCRIDADSGYCLGCLRDIDEIVDWGRLSSPQRLGLWAVLAERAGTIITPPDAPKA